MVHGGSGGHTTLKNLIRTEGQGKRVVGAPGELKHQQEEASGRQHTGRSKEHALQVEDQASWT